MTQQEIIEASKLIKKTQGFKNLADHFKKVRALGLHLQKGLPLEGQEMRTLKSFCLQLTE